MQAILASLLWRSSTRQVTYFTSWDTQITHGCTSCNSSWKDQLLNTKFWWMSWSLLGFPHPQSQAWRGSTHFRCCFSGWWFFPARMGFVGARWNPLIEGQERDTIEVWIQDVSSHWLVPPWIAVGLDGSAEERTWDHFLSWVRLLGSLMALFLLPLEKVRWSWGWRVCRRAEGSLLK